MKANEKICPACAETIKVDARVCRHCGHQFTDEELQAHKSAEQKKRGIGCGVALALVLLVGFCVSKLPPPAPTGGEASKPAAGSGNEAAATEAKEVSQWTYSESKDEMRGTRAHFAELESENSVDLDFPYSGGKLTLQVRQRPEDGLQIILTIPSGQFLCNSFTNTTISAKFDSGPVRKFRCTGTSAGNSDTIFLGSPASFLKSLKSSKVVMIEPEFFQSGGRQFTFHTSGLEWK